MDATNKETENKFHQPEPQAKVGINNTKSSGQMENARAMRTILIRGSD